MRYLLALLLSIATVNAGPWSGCCVTQYGYPGTAGTIHSVQGSFVVPSIPSVEQTDVSFWVGIGGYGSRDIQQIGIDVYYTEGQLWTCCWTAANPKKLTWQFAFQPSPGDKVTLSTRYLGRDKQGDKFELRAVNNATGDTFTEIIVVRNATRNSAEFICEKGSGWALPSAFATTWTDLSVNSQPVNAWNWQMVNQLGITVTPMADNSFSVRKP